MARRRVTTLPPPKRPQARWRSLGAALLLLASWLPAISAAVPKEYELKAAFLYNFTKFVSWPAESFETPQSPLVIGVLGKSPFQAELVEAIRARKADGREIVLREIADAEAARGVHLMFVPAAEDYRMDELLTVLRGRAVLIVGESEVFSDRGGMITFVVDANKLRFVIDVGAAEKAGLKISSQLQKLAKHVRRGT